MQTIVAGAQGEDKEYCTKCGNSGKIPPGNEPCECRRKSFIYELPQGKAIDFVPEHYVGKFYQQELAPDKKEGYPSFLSRVHDEIVMQGKCNKNYYIASSARGAKQIFAYSVIQALAVNNTPVFPILDLHEIRRYMLAHDAGKEVNSRINMEAMYNVPALFVKSIGLPTREILESLHLLIDRRVRQGNGTVILSGIYWKSFIAFDKYGVMGPYSGEGTGNTIAIREWFSGI